MIFRTHLIKNRKYKDLAIAINKRVELDKKSVVELAGHQYEWAKHELNAWESEPGVFECEGVRFVKQSRG